jgi:hypothetical protein
MLIPRGTMQETKTTFRFQQAPNVHRQRQTSLSADRSFLQTVPTGISENAAPRFTSSAGGHPALISSPKCYTKLQSESDIRINSQTVPLINTSITVPGVRLFPPEPQVPEAPLLYRPGASSACICYCQCCTHTSLWKTSCNTLVVAGIFSSPIRKWPTFVEDEGIPNKTGDPKLFD